MTNFWGSIGQQIVDASTGWQHIQMMSQLRNALIVGGIEDPDRYLGQQGFQDQIDALGRMGADYWADGMKAIVSQIAQQAHPSGSGSGFSGGGSSGGGGASNEQLAQGFESQIRELAGQMGLDPNDPQWGDLASQAVGNKWTIETLRHMVANNVNMDTATHAGSIHDTFDKTKAAAADYMVRTNNEEMLGWAKQVASGDLNEQSILGQIKDRAKQQYSWLSNTIDSGTTLKQYFQPHVQEIAKLLEVAPDQVDLLNDSRFANVLHKAATADDPIDRSMTVGETAAMTRGLDAWKSTSNAKDSAATGITTLAKTLGAM
jgi:hypothetical protein